MFSKALSIVFALSITFANAEEFISINNYIDRYKDLAITEMDRTGIPASIKLGQAIMESQHGNSNLARNSNNHFGIKCKEEWTGKKYFHKDDDRDRRGRLIKSCFRVYSDVPDSYVDHSEFLLSRPRYSILFIYQKDDYKSWAKGLKKAGYATAKHYANTLIRTIEENNLHRFDKMTNQVLAFTEKPTSNFHITNEYRKEYKDITPLQPASLLNPLIIPNNTPSINFLKKEKIAPTSKLVFINGIPAVKLEKGLTFESIANQQNVAVDKLVTYNQTEKGYSLSEGQYVFLKKKKKSSEELKEHKVMLGETLYDVSQLYGIQVERLAKLNKMKKDEQPAIGLILRLR